MARHKNWRQDGPYAFKRGRPPLRARVTISTHNRWTGVLEWYPLTTTKDPHRIPMTHRFASPEKAMEALDERLDRFKRALDRLAKWT